MGSVKQNLKRNWDKPIHKTGITLIIYNHIQSVAASTPVSERSVKLRKTKRLTQVPQGWGLLCQLLQRSRCRTCWGERSSRF